MQKTANLRNTVPIIYASGHYGSYLYWVLDNFTNVGAQNSKHLPFTKSGSSHNQTVFNKRDRRAYNWISYLEAGTYFPFITTHYNSLNPEVTDLETIAGFVDEILDHFDNGIIIQHDPRHIVLSVHNRQEKINHWDLLTSVYDTAEYPLNSVAQKREYLSFKLFDVFFENKNFTYRHNPIRVDLHDLLFDFEKVLLNITGTLNLELTDSLETIMQNHSIMLSRQQHLHKDKELRAFINAFVNHKNCKLPNNCNIIDEAYIQKCLRDELKIELRCNDIGDVFPTTTEELWKYAYSAEE